MTIPEYTTVVGVDADRLPRLAQVWSTWKRYKPSLLWRPMIVFRDRDVEDRDVRVVVDHPDLRIYEWPPVGTPDDAYGIVEDGSQTPREQYRDLWDDPQRYKMLAGFVHVPAEFVRTEYWLKLDLSVLADGQDDWIDPMWFRNEPVIVSHRWGYTKPATQMLQLDRWVEDHKDALTRLALRPPLDLRPEHGSDRLSHRRITSWCAFFSTNFTMGCSVMASATCGAHRLPVPSQDGFMWYVARRLGLGIKRVNMKSKGWKHRPVRPYSMEAVK